MDFLEPETFECYLIRTLVLVEVKDNLKVFEGP